MFSVEITNVISGAHIYQSQIRSFILKDNLMKQATKQIFMFISQNKSHFLLTDSAANSV